MRNFQFAQIFASKRKELHVTQDQIAGYVGVSRAAVSKWEKGLSYPDITLLPKLATYFNMTIDTLLGYEPQMTKERMMQTYAELAEQFASEPFEVVDAQIDELLNEYYSCFPFILKMVQLYMNYFMKAENPQRVFEKILQLCERVKTMADDYQLSNEVAMIEAYVHLMQGKTQEVFELLGEGVVVQYGVDQLIARAQIMDGQTEKAKVILQVSMYQQLIYFISSATELLALEVENEAYFDEMVERIEQLFDTYQIENLQVNSTLVFYLQAAVGYMKQNRIERALQMLKNYTEICMHITFPLELHGDAHFYLLEHWIEGEMKVLTQVPRDELSIKKDIVGEVVNNPAFSGLQEHSEYKAMLLNLKHHLKLEEE